jgi:uncharacterized protein YbjT (DUF2867 family)
MNMKVAIAGSTGMIGNLVQAICLDHEDITEVSSLVRKPTWTQHDKLTETVIEDFEDYSGHDEVFKDVGVGFFCIGAYTGQVPDDLFKKITLDYAVALAEPWKSKIHKLPSVCSVDKAPIEPKRAGPALRGTREWPKISFQPSI